MLPKLESLRCFQQAAASLNFRRAAAAVGLSPAAFGERIKDLEDQVGRQLFIRTARQVWLTSDGERLLGRARETLSAARACFEEADVEVDSIFELTIGVPFEPGLTWLVPSLTPLNEARPERKIHLYFGNDEELQRRVADGAVDCAISTGRVSTDYLRHEVLHREPYAFVARPAVVARRKLVRSVDAKRHRILDLHAGLPLFDYFLSARPAGEKWTFSGGEYLGAVSAVQRRLLEGAGVAVLPRRLVERDLGAGALTELMPKTIIEHDDISLVWRVGHPFDEDLRRLACDLRALPLAK
jgi:LysR family glycine cleavage system transcriptional activator